MGFSFISCYGDILGQHLAVSGVSFAAVERSLGVVGRSSGVILHSLVVLGRHWALLGVSLGSPGALQNVQSELRSSGGVSVAGNTPTTFGFSMILRAGQSSPRSCFGLFGVPQAVLGVTLGSAMGRPWRRLGTSSGVLQGVSGVRGLHLGSFGGLKKSFSKTKGFCCIFKCGRPLGELERLPCVLWGRRALLGCPWALLGNPPASPGVTWISKRRLRAVQAAPELCQTPLGVSKSP